MAEAAFKPPAFKGTDTNASSVWREYKEEMDNYLMAAGLSEADGERKVAILLYGMGPKYRKVFKSLTFENDAAKKNYDIVTTKFDNHFEPKKLTKLYMKKFDSCMQGANEPIGEYIAKLRAISEHCEFGDTLNNQLCKQISSGVHDKTLRDKLWGEDLTLEQIVAKCHLFEQRQTSKDVIDGDVKPSAEVHYNKRGRGRGRGNHRGRGHGYGRGNSRGRGNSYGHGNSHPGRQNDRGGHYRGGQSRGSGQQHNRQRDGQHVCGNCGGSHPPRRCPAYGKTCHHCSRLNHFSKMCRQRTHDTVRVYETERVDSNANYDDSGSEYEFTENFVWYNDGGSNINSLRSRPDWSKVLEIPGCGKVCFKLDTGADTSVISKQTYDSLSNKPPLMESKADIIGLGEQPVYPIGTVTLSCLYNDATHYLACEVVDSNVPNLLCLSDCVKLDLVRLVNNTKTTNAIVDKSKQKVEWPKGVKECTYPSAKCIVEEFSDVFSGVGKVPGTVKLKVNSEISPVAHPYRPVPVSLRDAVQAKLKELEDADIIEKVPVGTPTQWCSALHVVPKKDKSVRITIDPKDLNKALLREYHPTNTVDDVAQRCKSARYLTVLDANQGYFQLALDEESKDYTSFNTPYGRFRYKRLPMGITSAPELFQRVFGDIFSSVSGLEIIMDDFLIACDTLEEHNKILRQTLQTARENNVTFSAQKLQLCTDSVKYAGHLFTNKGLQLDTDRIRAIVEMPEPKSIENVHTLLGMVTYVGKFLENLSAITEPLRSLIKESHVKGFKWHFDEIHKEAFQKIKDALSSAPVLRYYSLKEPVTISCDASQSGLGCVLLQGNAPVAYGSKALTDAEYAYAQIEKELLAIVFAFKKFHTYIYGRQDITVETDHAPLVRIMEKPLYQVPLRLQKMRMKLQGYDFQLIAKKGTEIPVADALSRAHLRDTAPVINVFTVSSSEIANVTRLSSPRLEEIKEKTVSDPELQAVINVVISPEGWPEQSADVNPLVRPYFDFQEEMNVVDKTLYKGQRVVIPRSMRSEALDILHAAHQGMVNTKKLARDLMYWPGINKQIEDVVSKCSECQEWRRRQEKEPLSPTPIPDGPWEHVAQDLFDCLGHKWLICVDYYSEFFEMERMDNGTTGDEVIKQTKKWFSVHGIPSKLTSDNGPPWNGNQFKQFAERYGFKHTLISPHHSQSNGMAEKTVDIAKKMLIKCHESNTDPYLALLNIRNTPRDDVTGSPVQRLFARRTRTKLPVADAKLVPEVKSPALVRMKLKADRHVRARRYYDRGTKELSPLRPGDTIRVRVGKSWKPALLLPQDGSTQPRSYKIQLPSGKMTRRNRRHILRTNEGNIYRREQDFDIDLENIQVPEPIIPVERAVAVEPASQRRSGPMIGPAVIQSQAGRNTSPRKMSKPNSPVKVHQSKPVNPPDPNVPNGSAPKPVFTRSGRLSKPSSRFQDFVK